MNSKNFAKNERGEPQNSTRAVTARILASDGNTVRLSIVTLFCILLGILIVLEAAWLAELTLSEAVLQIPPLLVALLALSLALIFGGLVFVFFPCLSGVVFFARRTVNGERPSFATLFEPFTSKSAKKYVNSICLPIAILLRMAIMFLPLVGGIINFIFFMRGAHNISLFGIVSGSAFVLALSLLALAVGMYLSSFFFFVPYLLIRGEVGFCAALVLSVRMSRSRRMEITKEMARQVPAVILSVLSFMVLWVFYAAPRMLVSYFVYCDKVAELNNEYYYF